MYDKTVMHKNSLPPNENRKSCYDCDHMKAALSWWCTNEEAIKYRNSNKPNVHNCHFWKPVSTYKELNIFEKIFPFFFGILFIKNEKKDDENE